MGLGQRLTHSTASCKDAHFHSQKPATNSFVSANGPSVTVRFSPVNLTRAPFELACSPSPASITPALIRSWLNFPISERSSSLGRAPASEDLVALTITMNRIFVFPSWFGGIVSSTTSRSRKEEIDNETAPQSSSANRRSKNR